MTKRYWEEIEIGEEFTSPSRTITEADIVMFGALTGDFMGFHMDEEFARTTIYGGRIAHGLLGLAYMGGLEMLAHFDIASMGTLGWSVDFRAPIRIGDTVTARFKVASKRETSKPDRGIVAIKAQLFNQRNELLQDAEHRRMVKRRPMESSTSTGVIPIQATS